MPGPMGDMMGYGWVGMLLGFLLLLAVLAAIIVGVVFVVRALWKPGGPERGVDSPAAEETLRERYARGEISHDEFEQRRRTLGA